MREFKITAWVVDDYHKWIKFMNPPKFFLSDLNKNNKYLALPRLYKNEPKKLMTSDGKVDGRSRRNFIQVEIIIKPLTPKA